MESLVEYHSMPFILLGQGEPRRVQTGVVSANFFDVLGVRPLRGRAFRPGEDQPSAEPVLVLSYGFWMNRLGGDPAIVGKTFEMNDRIHTVIGVLPPVPQYPAENDVYMPSSSCPFRMGQFTLNTRTARMLHIFGRMAPGMTVVQAQTELEGIAGTLRSEYPASYPSGQGFTISATSLHDELTKDARPTLLLLIGTTAFVLLIACANIANLTLARLTRRSREMALRAALGADRVRLFRQMLTESGLLALAGGALGLALAAATMRLLTGFAARFTPRASEISLDGEVLAFTLVVCVLTGLAFAVLPALPARANLVAALKEGGAAVSGGGSSRIRAALVVAQVAVSMVLLIGAGLMLRSLLELQSVNPGFDSQRVLTMTMDLNWSRYTSNDLILGFHDRLNARLAGQPGVVSTASHAHLPAGRASPVQRQLPDRRAAAGGRRRPAAGRPAQRLARVFPDPRHSAGDREAVHPVRRAQVAPGGDRQPDPRAPLLPHARPRSASASRPTPARPGSRSSVWWATSGTTGSRASPRTRSTCRSRSCRSGRAPSSFAPPPIPPPWRAGLERRCSAIDPGQPIANVQTLEEVRGEALANPRLTTTLVLLFALLALCITAAGLGGVVAFSVSQRTQEIGVRMALGAGRGEVLGMVLREGLRLVGLGLVLGALAAVLLGRLITGLLYHVETTDPITFVGMGLVLVLIAAVACLVPARRAATVDPLVALRAY